MAGPSAVLRSLMEVMLLSFDFVVDIVSSMRLFCSLNTGTFSTDVLGCTVEDGASQIPSG